MLNQPLVSVIINCFNGEKYLNEAIESVLNQTYSNWEIIFWDNRSTDGSSIIINSYNDERIRYYLAPNHTTLYKARNLAIKYARGDFISFIDVDDIWLPEKLELQIPLFDDNQVSLVYSNFFIKNEIKHSTSIAIKKALPSGDAVLTSFLDKYVVGILTLIIRKSDICCVDEVFNPNYQIIGDFDFVIRMASKHRVARVQIPVATYRVHSHNMTSNQWSRLVLERESWVKEYSDNTIIGNDVNFKNITLQNIYLKALGLIVKGKRSLALKLCLDMKISKPKLKLIFFLLIPKYFIFRIRS